MGSSRFFKFLKLIGFLFYTAVFLYTLWQHSQGFEIDFFKFTRQSLPFIAMILIGYIGPSLFIENEQLPHPALCPHCQQMTDKNPCSHCGQDILEDPEQYKARQEEDFRSIPKKIISKITRPFKDQSQLNQFIFLALIASLLALIILIIL